MLRDGGATYIFSPADFFAKTGKYTSLGKFCARRVVLCVCQVSNSSRDLEKYNASQNEKLAWLTLNRHHRCVLF